MTGDSRECQNGMRNRKVWHLEGWGKKGFMGKGWKKEGEAQGSRKMSKWKKGQQKMWRGGGTGMLTHWAVLHNSEAPEPPTWEKAPERSYQQSKTDKTLIDKFRQIHFIYHIHPVIMQKDRNLFSLSKQSF